MFLTVVKAKNQGRGQDWLSKRISSLAMTPSYFNTHLYLKLIKTLIPPDEPNALALEMNDDIITIATKRPLIAFKAWENRDLLPPQYGLQVWLRDRPYGCRPSIIRQFENGCEIEYIQEERDEGNLTFHLFESVQTDAQNWSIELKTPDIVLLNRIIKDHWAIGQYAQQWGIRIVRLSKDDDSLDPPLVTQFASNNPCLKPKPKPTLETFSDALAFHAQTILALPKDVEVTVINQPYVCLRLNARETISLKWVFRYRHALAFRLEEKLGIPHGAIEIDYRGEYCTRASSLKGLRNRD